MRSKRFIHLSLLLAALWFSFALSGAALAQAQTVTTSDIITIDRIEPVPCAADGAGENVHITGTVRVDYSMTTYPNGSVRIVDSYRVESVTGVGLTTGTQYIGRGRTVSRFRGFVDSYPFRSRFVNVFKLIGKGRAPDLRVYYETLTIVDRNGNTRVDRETIRITCE
jgi:hypothetical protein